GAGGQRGLQSILDHAASQQVARLRIGIDRPPGVMDAAEYVLRPFTAEQAALLPVVLEEAATAMECFVRDGIHAAMNRHNRDVG
ncbi:MAG: aminoacyl-tRNA hydrolase, partial [Chloroflexi bacterium]